MIILLQSKNSTIMKSIYLDTHFPKIYFPSIKTTTYPSSHTYGESRRGNRMINKQADYHMYLNAAHQPSEEQAKNTELKSTEADVKLNAPYLEMMNTIKSLETQLNQKIDNLRQKGVQGIIEEKMEKTRSSSQPEHPNVT